VPTEKITVRSLRGGLHPCKGPKGRRPKLEGTSSLRPEHAIRIKELELKDLGEESRRRGLREPEQDVRKISAQIKRIFLRPVRSRRRERSIKTRWQQTHMIGKPFQGKKPTNERGGSCHTGFKGRVAEGSSGTHWGKKNHLSNREGSSYLRERTFPQRHHLKSKKN